MLNVESSLRESRHLISFYDDKEDKQHSFQRLRKIARIYLLEGYGVIYGAEPFEERNLNGQDIIVRKIIEANDIPKDSADLLKAGGSKRVDRDNLFVINPYAMPDSDPDSREIVDYWLWRYSEAEQKFSTNKNKLKGIIGINIPDPFYEKNAFDKFIGFEQNLEKAFGDRLGLICWYKKKWLKSLTLPQLIKILLVHDVLFTDLRIVKLDSTKIIDMITKTIDNIPGEDDEEIDDQMLSTMLFETIRHAYHTDKYSLVSQPDKLEQILKKMVGNQRYDDLQDRIISEIIKKIMESSDDSSSGKRIDNENRKS